MSDDTQLLGDAEDVIPTTEAIVLSGISELELLSNSSMWFPSSQNDTDLNVTLKYESEYLLFEKFVILEIVMTTLELIVSVWAAVTMPRWRKNYRNQMLMQLTLARFLKRVIFVIKFLDQYHKISSMSYTKDILNCCQFYVDFVIVILVFFFIKHMYNSLIIVVVKISQHNLLKEIMCSWVIPVPISTLFTVLIATNILDRWFVYLIICTIFRWPLIFTGTGLYIIIVYRVITDKIRHFARSLAVVTFLLCLIINVYLFSKDIIELWYLEYSNELITYVFGFLLNLLILCLYIVLIVLNCNNTTSKCKLPNYSLTETKF